MINCGRKAESMKELREIKSVSIFNENSEERSPELTIGEFDSEPGYYRNVIRPMLIPGHEGELIAWLKSTGLIVQSPRCKNAENDICCQAPMVWKRSRNKDNGAWMCPSCSQIRRIRDNSPFQEVKCNFQDTMRIMLGWCKSIDVDTLAKILGLRKQLITPVYNLCTKAATNYVKSTISQKKIGGPGIIVVIDVFPECSKDFNRKNIRRSLSTILCVAEIKDFPTRYWLQVLDRFSYNSPEQVVTTTQMVLMMVQELVHPGSILVTTDNKTVCSYNTLQQLRHIYPTIVTLDDLVRHDYGYQSLMVNLETIWEPAFNICEDALQEGYVKIQDVLINRLWVRQFGSTAFEMLMNQLCSW